MNHGIKAIIFSVFSAEVSHDVNDARTEYVTAALTREGINYQLAKGVYKSISETVIIVRDTPRNWQRVSGWAALFSQESLLRIDSAQQGRLITPDGWFISNVGHIKAVPQQVAIHRDAYTLVDGRYYVGDAA